MTFTKNDLTSLDEPNVRSPKGHEAAVSNARSTVDHDQRSLLDMMDGMPSSDGIEFDFPCVTIELQDVDFDPEN